MSEAGSPLVSVSWLRERQAQPELVILDASIGRGTSPEGGNVYFSGRTGFEQDGHLPGARFADLTDAFSDPEGRFLFTRPTEAGLRAATRKLGIDASSIVVVYDRLNGAWAARVWWILRSYGHARVQVLDGGLNQWREAGGALEFGPSADPGGGDFVPAEQPGAFVDLADVDAAMREPESAILVCANRRSDFARAHIPGSLNLPYQELLGPAGEIDMAQVGRAIRPLHDDAAGSVILYCGGGINASGVALGMAAAGMENFTIFDGSLNEWMADPTRPIARDPA